MFAKSYGTTMLVTALIGLISCHPGSQPGDSLSSRDITYIQGLGILDPDETILLFDSQGGFDGIETSGNFISSKRIASYWVDLHDSTQSDISSAYYPEIDAITPVPLPTSLTSASYLEVHKSNGQRFRVYVDGDSTVIWNFFNKAVAEWTTRKNLK
jgi:hypothetical protein